MAIKTNERPGTRAVLRHSRMSSTKAREVLDLIRGLEYTRAAEIVAHTDRAAATVIGKLLHSCAANAEHNEGLDPTELFVASCYADEGATLKRWRPRARGRATRIRKRSCHITIILARMPEDRLARQRARTASDVANRRARRVAGTRRRDAEQTTTASPAEEAGDLLLETEAPLGEDGTFETGEVETGEVETGDVETGEAVDTAESAGDVTAIDEAATSQSEEQPTSEDESGDAEGDDAVEKED